MRNPSRRWWQSPSWRKHSAWRPWRDMWKPMQSVRWPLDWEWTTARDSSSASRWRSTRSFATCLCMPAFRRPRICALRQEADRPLPATSGGNWRRSATARMLRRLMIKKTYKLLLLAFGISIGLSLGLAPGAPADKPEPAKPDALGQDMPWQDARLLAEVLERVEREYVAPLDDHQLLQAAIRGMVSSLDPYSAYLDGEEYDDIKISASGEYSGVGIEISIEDDQVIVIAPFDGSPAAKAGIHSGDIIVTIDGIPVNTSALNDTIGRMRGAEGSSVKIGIMRDGNPEPIQFTLKRSRVELHSVRAELLEPGLGYARISEFSDTTGDDLNAAIKDLRKRNGAALKGLVL